MFFIDWQHDPLVDFSTLNVGEKPHYCVILPHCPANYIEGRCIQAPVLPVGLATLQQYWQKVLAHQPRVKLLRQKQTHAVVQYQYVQRSKWLRFPDLIDLRLVAISEHKSTLYAYSRSVYGYSDLGVNCRRMTHWLSELKAAI
jgi:uncharacterized protein (DUF1499 family)